MHVMYIRSEHGLKRQSQHFSWLMLQHEQSTFAYFGTFWTNLNFKDEDLNCSEDPHKACQT